MATLATAADGQRYGDEFPAAACARDQPNDNEEMARPFR
jgi:hypothetical protein